MNCKLVGRSGVVAQRHRSYHVAVVGSGPGGFYTSKYLFKQGRPGWVSVDMFERLPIPFGLVRYGVAPDHPEVKNVINDFTEVAEADNFRFVGNVEVGKHVSLKTLEKAYDAVVVCTGAEGERTLGIPGEDSRWVVGAPAFVKWYNGHPDYTDVDPPAPGASAIVLGQGNVALDIARLLSRSESELQATDIHPAALAKIGQWQREGLQTIHVVGRRGFVQAAFTNKELREQLNISDDVLAVVDPAELELCRNAASEEEMKSSRAKKRSVSILEKMAKNFDERETTSKRVVWFRFLLSPSEVLADPAGAVTGVRFDKTRLEGEAGAQRAVKTGETEDIACGLVLRSVGFGLTPLAGLPLEGGSTPHERGRVVLPEGGRGRLYVSGWAKRGPTGVIATNIPDATETAKAVAGDIVATPSRADPVAALREASAAGARLVSFRDWRRLEAEEVRRGTAAGRPATKLTDVDEMLGILGAPA